MEDFSQAKTIWSLAEWEPDEVKRQSLASEAIVKLERALSTPLDKQMQAACHNIAGQCHVKLGQESEARASFESALKANKHMRQAQAQLDRVNARSAAKARAEKSARQKRNRQMYCCYVFPRCSRGPCKPEVEDFGGPAYAKLRQKTHVLTAVVAGADTDVDTPPPQISFAWQPTDTSEAKKVVVDKDVLALLESSKLNGNR